MNALATTHITLVSCLVLVLFSDSTFFSGLENSGFHNQSKPKTVDPSAQSAGQELHASLSNLNKDTNLETMEMHSVAPLTPLVEDLLLTTKTEAGSDGPETGEMSDFNMSPIPDGLDFSLRKCLSPLESDDNDVPTREPSEQLQEELSETHKQDTKTQNLPLLLSESSSKSDFPLGSVIDSSRPHPWLDPNGSQDLKTHHENSSSVDQANIIELPKQRMTRRRLASQRLKESLESRAQSRLPKTKSNKIKEPKRGNVQLQTANSRGVSTQLSDRKTVAGVKRKQENCLPRSKKMCPNTTSKQHELKEDLPKVQVTARTVKRGRGRPPRSANIEQTCNDAKKMDRAVLEQNDKEPNTQEKDSTETREADVNGNFEQTKQNVRVKYSGRAKRQSITDQIFHKTFPSKARRSSLQPTANSQNTTSSPQVLQGPSEKSGERNVSCSKSIRGENETGMSVLINREEMDALDNQVSLQMSQSNMSHTVQLPVEKGERPAIEENPATVLQCDFQNDISVDTLTSEDPHAAAGCSANNNKPGVMERIDTTRIVQEMHTRDVENKMEAPVSNKQDCLENNEEEDLARCKVVQPMKETTGNAESEVQVTNHEDLKEIAECASNVGNKKSDDVDLDGGQYSSELSTGHLAGGGMTDDSSNAGKIHKFQKVIKQLFALCGLC